MIIKKNLFGAQSLESWAVWQQDIKSEWENFLLMRNRFLFVSKIHVWKWKAYLSFLSCCHQPVFVIRTQEAREWIGWRENPTRKLNLENLSIYLEKKLQQQEKAFLIIIQCTFLSLSLVSISLTLPHHLHRQSYLLFTAHWSFFHSLLHSMFLPSLISFCSTKSLIEGRHYTFIILIKRSFWECRHLVQQVLLL